MTRKTKKVAKLPEYLTRTKRTSFTAQIAHPTGLKFCWSLPILMTTMTSYTARIAPMTLRLSCDTDDVSLTSVNDSWEEYSFSSFTFTLILDPAALLEDKPSPYCLSPASDHQERGIDIATLNDSIAKLRGEKCNVSFVSSHYPLDSDEEDQETACNERSSNVHIGCHPKRTVRTNPAQS
ncbi:hypothetical protein OUZ56_003540 [Daphnia magna]|uniref:Uncharacterized protein n=1 Tax=Daphnia magna TaxID=35525 RepID=A0ABR0A994_9CRUS|nr:hypothetical protein OUZ56_003540 [Daphnia magna]